MCSKLVEILPMGQNRYNCKKTSQIGEEKFEIEKIVKVKREIKMSYW